MDVTGIILAGGKSRRMGEDKRYLRVGKATLLERTVATMTGIFNDVRIIIGQDSSPLTLPECQVHRDVIADCGSLGGLYTGLALASTARIFVVACDMPFLNPALIRWFLDRDPVADVVMACLSDGAQPMHAVYGKGALPALQRMAEQRTLKIRTLLDDPSIRATLVLPEEWGPLDPSGRSFQNVNTQADLEAARAYLRQDASIG
ncbi:MAG: molybdenum cofactor guanylyltransferase [Nitrospira sp.]